MDQDDDWELSKENVKPLKQGRSFLDMSMALQSSSSSRIGEEQDQFEKELRTYSGDDPLDVWFRYIHWTEQHFPTGGNKVQELIQNCVLYFKDEVRYNDDRRYISIWIKFANNTTEPDEMYSFLFNRNIGCKVAALYHAWASVLEQMDNTTKADSVYLKGIEMGAEPLDQLRKQHYEFQARVTRRLKASDPQASASFLPPNELDLSRSHLGELRQTGRHGHAPVNRIAIDRPTVVATTAGAAQHQPSRNAKLKIFTDENATTARELPEQNNEYASIPLPGEENQRKPAKWTDASHKQRHAPTAAAVLPPAPPIYHDAESKLPDANAHRVTEPTNVLAPRREAPRNNEAATLFASREPVPNQRLRYCHDKIYAGNRECSFEEMRAWRYFAKKKEAEDQQRKMDEMVQEKVKLLEADMMRNMQEQISAIVRQHLPAVQQQGQLPAVQQQEPLPVVQAVQLPDNAFPIPMVEPVNQVSVRIFADEPEPMVVSTTGHESLQAKMIQDLMTADACQLPDSPSHLFVGSRNAARTAPHEESSSFHQASLSAFSAVPRGSNTSSAALLLGDNIAAARLPSRAMQTTTGSHITSLALPSSHVAEASMTMNSKEAQKVIYDLFNQSLGFGQIPMAAAEDLELEKQFAVMSTTGAAAINDDEIMFKQPAVPQSIGFQIFNENQPMSFESDPKPVVQESGGKALALRPGVYVDKENVVQKTSAAAAVNPKTTDEPMMVSTARQPLELVANDVEMGEENAGWENDEITFHPGCSSTRVFNGTIPLRAQFFDAGATGQLPLNPEAATFVEDQQGITEKMTIRTSDPRNRMSSIFCGATSKLNTILEGSDESKSKGSSMASSGHPSSGSGGLTGMTPSIGLGSHNWTAAATPGNVFPTCQFSMYEDAAIKTECKPPLSVLDEKSNEGLSENDENNELRGGQLNATMHHVIDTAQYIAEPSDQTKFDLDQSVIIDTSNPFDEATVELLLSRLRMPITCYRNYHRVHEDLPKLTKTRLMLLDGHAYTIVSKLGEGAYARVYLVTVNDVTENFADADEKVAKIQQPSCPWEFYVTSELNRRLKGQSLPINMTHSYMNVDEAFFFNNGSCMVYSYHKYGTFLDLVNVLKRNKIELPEWFLMYLAVELIDIVQYMHRCQIIHGDFKPDNILINKMDGQNINEVLDGRCAGSFLKLIDFGQSIDMALFAPGTTFTAKVKTKGFQCTEMMTNRPWTYQTDLYGLIGTLHVLLFGAYMKVYYAQNAWRFNATFKRGAHDIWKHLFHDLLNIPNCSAMPELSMYRAELARLSKSLSNGCDVVSFIIKLSCEFVDGSGK